AAPPTPVREQLVAEGQRSTPIIAPSAVRPAQPQASTVPPLVSTQIVEEPELAITTAPVITSSGTPAPPVHKQSVEDSTKPGVVSAPAKATWVTSVREQIVAEADRPTPIVGPPQARPAQPPAPAAPTLPSAAMRTVDEPKWTITGAPVPSPVTSVWSNTP